MKKLTTLLLLISATAFGQVQPISGTLHGCHGASLLLYDPTPGGVWSSNKPSFVSIDATTGVATLNVATAVITYSVTGVGFSRVTVTVDPQPLPISGLSNICQGNSIHLTDWTAGSNTWSSSNAAVASLYSTTSGTTEVYGASVGTAVITFTRSNGCFVTGSVQVLDLPSITLGTSPTATLGDTYCYLPYTSIGSPTNADIIYDSTAHADGFSDYWDISLPSSLIPLGVPFNSAGVFNGVVIIRDANGCQSATAQPFTVTIN